MLPFALPQKSRDGGNLFFFVNYFYFQFFPNFLNFMPLSVNFGAILLIESIKILGTELFSRDGRQPEAQEFFLRLKSAVFNLWSADPRGSVEDRQGVRRLTRKNIVFILVVTC